MRHVGVFRMPREIINLQGERAAATAQLPLCSALIACGTPHVLHPRCCPACSRPVRQPGRRGVLEEGRVRERMLDVGPLLPLASRCTHETPRLCPLDRSSARSME